MTAIRPYRPASDESAVFELWQAALGETWPLTRAMFANVIKGSATGERGVHLVATSQGRIVGFVGTGTYSAPFGTIGYVPALFVAPAVQRRGIGTALMRAVAEHLRTLGDEDALAGLFTGPHLHPFYAQFGFRGPRNGRYGMAREL